MFRDKLGIFTSRTPSFVSDGALKQINPLIYETNSLLNGLSLPTSLHQDLLIVKVRFIAAVLIILTLSD